MTRSLTTLFAVAVLAVLALPGAGQAATTEGFAGVLADGTLTTFTSQVPSNLSPPRAVRGLARGERLIALASTDRATYGIGSVGRLYAIDTRLGAAAPVGPPFPMGLRGLRASLAVAQDGSTGQVVTDVGQRLAVDLRTGAVTELEPLRTTSGAATSPVVAMLADGRLTGVDPVAGTAVTEVAPGAGVVSTTALALPRGTILREPMAVARASDGRLFLGSGAQDDTNGDGNADAGGDVRQSRIFRVDAATGRVQAAAFGVLGRELIGLASIGAVPADERVRGATVRMPRRVSARRLLSPRSAVRSRGLGLTVRADEPVQVVFGLRVRGQRVSFNFASSSTPGETLGPGRRVPLDPGSIPAARRSLLRSAIGSRISVVVNVRDRAGNRITVNRRFTLVP